MTRDYQPSLFLIGGNLNNGGNAGSAYLNLNNGLGNSNWNIGGRNCGKIANFKAECRGGNNPQAAPAASTP